MLSFEEQYEKYKNLVHEEIIVEFAEEYRDIIFPRLNNNSIFFQSTPEEEYIFMGKEKKSLSLGEKLKIRHNNKKFKQAKIIEKRKLKNEFIQIIQSSFDIGEEYKDVLEKVAFLFGDENFDSSYIDSFSSKSIQQLDKDYIPQSLKDNITGEQEFKDYRYQSLINKGTV